MDSSGKDLPTSLPTSTSAVDVCSSFLYTLYQKDE